MKFKNLFSQTGTFTFEGARISFNGDVEAKGALAEMLSAHSAWERLDKEPALDEELEALRAEAKELGLKPHHAAKAAKIKELIEAHKEGNK